MNFIAKNIQIAGLLALLSFTAAAAAIYLDVPNRWKDQPATQTAKYICPMHHEVVSPKPGNCPKCGMALVVMSAAENKGDGCGHEGGGCCGSIPSDNQILSMSGLQCTHGTNAPDKTH